MYRPAYIGRFAPTPSGPLHLGSLLTALAGWLQARCNGGQWLIRIDDLDRPRCPPGADEQILRQLEAHHLNWDGTPRYQSRHTDEYRAVLAELRRDGRLYACHCTRAQLANTSRAGPDGPVYAGTCRANAVAGDAAWRLTVSSGRHCIDDDWQGPQCRDLETEVGDFVLLRSDGVPGYQLASVIDERAQGITEVVRGSDLLGSSIRQAYLFDVLGWRAPDYRHLPLLVNHDGLKLSKQNHATPIEESMAGADLWRCLQYLRQDPPADLRNAPVAVILEWAALSWQPQRFAGHLRCTLVE